MLQLIASREGQQQWCHDLNENQSLSLGRSPHHCQLVIESDPQISRLHATLIRQGDQLVVRQVPSANNPIFVDGIPQDVFQAAPGSRFVIGQTLFEVRRPQHIHVSESSSQTDVEFTIDARELARATVNSDLQLAALVELPELFRQATTEDQYQKVVAEVLLRGVPQAAVAAVVRLDPTSSSQLPECEWRAWDTAGAHVDLFRPDGALVWRAVQQEQQPYLHTWKTDDSDNDAKWAICCPLPVESHAGWCVYLESPPGRMLEIRRAVNQGQFASELRFAHLVARMFASLREVRKLSLLEAELARYFSPPVLRALRRADRDIDIQPRLSDVVVLFCDLRGSCRIAESGEDLLANNARISEALGIMTDRILLHHGSIGDFQGDAAMGFWGWPERPDQFAVKACEAALAIRNRFQDLASSPGHLLAGFSCGLGLAAGQAVAGRLGTIDQRKIGVFGPVVNLAARLESMTKILRASIVIDETLARLVQDAPQFSFELRRIARLVPAGMSAPQNVYELLDNQPADPDFRRLTLSGYAAALEQFECGNWAEAARTLAKLHHDGPAQFLLSIIAQRDTAPPDWQGVIHLSQK